MVSSRAGDLVGGISEQTDSDEDNGLVEKKGGRGGLSTSPSGVVIARIKEEIL
jgi:hypothetical protein